MFRVVIRCKDCTGQDSNGCFGGGTRTLNTKFSTLDEAKDAGCKFCMSVGMYLHSSKYSPWDFTVYNEHGRSVYDSAMM